MFRLILTVLVVVMLTDLMLWVDAGSGNTMSRGENVAKILYCAQKETHIFNVAISNELFD